MYEYFNRVYFLILFLLFFVSDTAAMNRQQLKNSGKLLKKTCMPKHDVTEEQVGKIDQGNFLEEKNVMCYVACIYSVGGAVKNNKIVHEAMIKQVDMMFPAEMKDPVKAAMEKCKGVDNLRNRCTCLTSIHLFQLTRQQLKKSSQVFKKKCMAKIDVTEAKKYKDLCEASYWTAKCIYEDDPKNFVFA
ncbi:hypothetical protein MSG28_004624 [Choristoneura fumiferana]|uniref:Uncharacterized protein n=1 Tax=Choristoneura fumiferana TaxID=7141 RepID=A0ACC0K7N2_CHOFU|nr:hypothetical protein MSG28_004624 [Choristoneura fumiferana]